MPRGPPSSLVQHDIVQLMATSRCLRDTRPSQNLSLATWAIKEGVANDRSIRRGGIGAVTIVASAVRGSDAASARSSSGVQTGSLRGPLSAVTVVSGDAVSLAMPALLAGAAALSPVEASL